LTRRFCLGRGTEPSYIVQKLVGDLPAMLVIFGFIVSHLVWIFSDERVWWWDQAAYGTFTLQLWEAWRHGAAEWLSAMIHAVGFSPPLLVWLGQFLVPLRRLTGETETAILLINVLAAIGTLWLVYITSRRLGAGLAGGIVAIVTCAGSQIFIELSNQYFMEAVQCFAAALTMFAAWHAEKRSWLRSLSVTVAAVALSFLAKATSVIFVLPMLTYVLVSSVIARRQIRAHWRPRDLIVAVVAAGIAGAAVTWYAANWSAIADHFKTGTVSKMALYWGAPVHFPMKLEYWTQTFAAALSPFSVLSACLAVVIAIALVVAVMRCFRNNTGAGSDLMVENGTLFALALAGTIVMTIVVFSLQITEIPRYLISLVPLFSVLIAWSLDTLRSRLLLGVVLAAQMANALVGHTSSHGGNPFRFFPQQGVLSPKPWPLSVVTNPLEKLSLAEAVRLTCGVAGKRNFVVAQYPSLNASAVSFYMEKSASLGGFHCDYGWFGFFPTDVHQALDIINSFAPVDILTIAPENQPLIMYENQPPSDLFKFNVVTRPVVASLARDPAYELVPCCGGHILIYRRVGASQ
jgi:hypothetical protein